MSAEIYDIDNGERLEAEELAPSSSEDIARLFEEMAAEARDGKIESFVAVVMRTQISYSVRCWRNDTLRILGALEAAKMDIMNAEREVDISTNGG